MSNHPVPDYPAPRNTGDSVPSPQTFYLSPLIRITLLGLYGALLFPMPFLAYTTSASISPWLLGAAILLGGILLYAALAERVIVNAHGIRVAYPRWVPGIWRSGWSLAWAQVKALKPRSTGQGGIVYYFLSKTEDRAYLLPMRVAGFSQLVDYVQAMTGIDTRDVRPLAQPWMYFILLSFTLILLLMDSWVVGMALSHKLPMPL